MQNLKNFLNQQEQSGLIDSTGEFTISADKAMTKLAQNQLPDPSYWILKLMQFASAYGAEAVKVVVGKKICKLEVLLTAPIAMHQLQKGLDSVATLDNPALNHLTTGLRALGGMPERRFALRLSDLECSEYLLWDGKELSFKQERVESSSLALSLEVTASGPQMWNKLVDTLSVQTRAKEAALLTEKAFTVPFSLSMDGRALGFSQVERSRWFTQAVISDFFSSDKGFALPHTFESQASQSVEGKSKNLILEALGKGETRASAFWHISYNYVLKHQVLHFSPVPESRACGSYLHWLRDGVLVKTERLSRSRHAFSLELFVDANDCEADISGLNLRVSDAYRAQRKFVKELLIEINKRASLQLREATGLWGRTLGGWASVTATRHIPMTNALTYEKPGRLSNTLNSLPGFRKSLLAAIKRQKVQFGKFLP